MLFRIYTKFKKFRTLKRVLPDLLGSKFFLISLFIAIGIFLNFFFSITPTKTEAVFGGPQINPEQNPKNNQINTLNYSSATVEASNLPEGVYGQIDENFINSEFQIGAASAPANPFFDPDSTGRDSIISYKVIEGDNLSSLAQKFSIDVATILSANPKIQTNYLAINQELIILPVNGILYTIKSGDTLTGLAARYNVSQAEIISTNNLNSENLQISQELILPGASFSSNNNSIATVSNSYLPNGFDWPAKGARGPLHGTIHPAYDIANNHGTPIYASASGIIERADWGYNGGYGNRIIINHPSARAKTLYAHMADFTASVGDSVVKGEVIGYIGSTGNSTGPHVHFEVRRY